MIILNSEHLQMLIHGDASTDRNTRIVHRDVPLNYRDVYRAVNSTIINFPLPVILRKCALQEMCTCTYAKSSDMRGEHQNRLATVGTSFLPDRVQWWIETHLEVSLDIYVRYVILNYAVISEKVQCEKKRRSKASPTPFPAEFRFHKSRI